MPGMMGADTGITPSGGDISSELGSVLGNAFDSAMDDTPPPAADPTPEPAAEPAPEPISEPVADEPVAEPADVTPEPTSDAPQYQLSPDGKSYLIPKNDFASIQGIQKYHTAVSQLYPTPQDAHVSFEHASNFRQISNDWITGGEPQIDAVMNYFAGGDHAPGSPIQQKFQQSFAKMAERMPQVLQRLNPQAHDAMRQSMVQSLVTDAYEKAALQQRPEDFNADGSPKEGSPFRLAQEMDFGLTGKYQTELKKIDPQARAQQDFERRQQEFNGQRTAMQTSQLGEFNKAHLEGAKFNEAGSLIDRTLAPIKSRYTDIAYGDLRSGIQNELVNAMMGKPTATYPQGIPGQAQWIAEHKQAFDQLVNDFRTSWQPTAPGRGLEGRAQAYRQDYINRASKFLPAIAKPRIETATRTPGAARTAAPKTAPRAVTQPRSAPAPDPNKRLSSDEWQKQLNDVLRVA